MEIEIKKDEPLLKETKKEEETEYVKRYIRFFLFSCMMILVLFLFIKKDSNECENATNYLPNLSNHAKMFSNLMKTDVEENKQFVLTFARTFMEFFDAVVNCEDEQLLSAFNYKLNCILNDLKK